jgi:quercetin dioxygenase-like cupin family protein
MVSAALSRRGFCCALVGAALTSGVAPVTPRGPERVARAQGPGVTTEVLARGRADYAEALDGPAEVITIQAALEPGASLPWHLHPGPVTAVITKGALSIYQADGCKVEYAAGDAVFVPRGMVHFERNEGAEVLEFVATFVVPPGSPLRVEVAPSTAVCAG